MALTGELTDLSLAELIEFFCNQRKTGRLKVVYPTGPGYFYLQSGSVVHARVGDLRGIEAVYYALTQKNAQFNFSPAFEAPEHSINQPWTSVVLEGLRRMDEGIKPPNPFTDTTAGAYEEAEPANEDEPGITGLVSEFKKQHPKSVSPEELPRAVPFLSQIEPASGFANRQWKLGAVFAAIVLIVGGVAVPWGWHARSKAAKAASEPKPAVVPEQTTSTAPTAPEATAPQPGSETASPDASSQAAELARRQHEARLKEEARKKALENPSAQSSTAASSLPRPQTSPANGAKKVTVTVTYDENGRVTQASGGDATALRIARQKRFPAGKPGSATITIPIN